MTGASTMRPCPRLAASPPADAAAPAAVAVHATTSAVRVAVVEPHGKAKVLQHQGPEWHAHGRVINSQHPERLSRKMCVSFLHKHGEARRQKPH
jgi:hypothetical protein